jgi:glycine oxidase
VEALLLACRRSGVRLVPDRVTELAVEADRVTGVVLAGGGRSGGGPALPADGPRRSLAAGTVVLAAGCWSGGLGGVAAEALPPVRPVKGQLLYLRGPADEPLCSRNVRGLEVYVVPRGDGRVVVGATVEEQGFDTRMTAGAVHDLLRAAMELLPDVAELELLETVVGLRPGSPDNAPMLGPAGPEGLVVATGHYRNGILLTPVTADAIAELLATGQVPELIAPFGPGRFPGGVPIGASRSAP